jgi:hypothetical protein
MAASAGSGDAAAQPSASVLDLHLAELRQIFDSMDPAPFRERDLDPKANEYIVDWARECPPDRPLALVVHLAAPGRSEAASLEARSAERGSIVAPGRSEAASPEARSAERGSLDLQQAARDAPLLGDAVREFYRGRAAATRQDLSRLFRTGRLSLLIGLAFFAAATAVGEALSALVSRESFAGLLRESLVIGGWVALWRPLEIFLYDWWPVRAQARLYDRLAAMQVSLRSAVSGPGAAT